jgi:hypothetical protein
MFKQMIAQRKETLRLREEAVRVAAEAEAARQEEISQANFEDGVASKHLDVFLLMLEECGTDEQKRTGHAPGILRASAEYIAYKYCLSVEKVLEIRYPITYGMLEAIAR